MNTRFLCTEVVVQQLTQPFIRTKNDIGSDGTLSQIQYLAVTSWAFSCLLLQLALRKMNISYKFEFLGRQYHAGSLNFLIGTLFARGTVFAIRTRNMVKSLKGECDDGQYCDGCYELISLTLAFLKCPIGSKYPTRSIRPVEIARYHHAM